jgi:outer membrane protein assembly factor BamE (lipoprotein component of BamABCDE complex)
MPLSAMRRFAPLVAAIVLAAVLASCSGMQLVQSRIEGYDISEDDLLQIRPGQSRELVQAVLGTPGHTNTFGEQVAWYYIETEVDRTAFGLRNIKSRTVLAVYFDNRGKVVEKAVYGLEDGKVINMETRRTPSFGQDRTFLEAILQSALN